MAELDAPDVALAPLNSSDLSRTSQHSEKNRTAGGVLASVSVLATMDRCRASADPAELPVAPSTGKTARRRLKRLPCSPSHLTEGEP